MWIDDLDQLTLANYTHRNKGCNIQLVGDSLFTAQMAFPIQADLQSALSFYIAEARVDGYINQEVAKFTSNSQCPAAATPSDGRLTLEEMASTFIVFGSFLFLAALVQTVQFLQSRGSSKVSVTKDTMPDLQNDPGSAQDAQKQILKHLEMIQQRLEQLESKTW